jgi:hypothetical protein
LGNWLQTPQNLWSMTAAGLGCYFVYRVKSFDRVVLQNGGKPLSDMDVDTTQPLDYDFRWAASGDIHVLSSALLPVLMFGRCCCCCAVGMLQVFLPDSAAH